MRRPNSVMMARDPEVLQTMLDFYARPGAPVVDVTCNERRMWKSVTWDGPVTYCDIDALVKPDVVCDFRTLPFEDDSIAVLIFDPPHLPRAGGSPKSMRQMKADYGLARAPKADNVNEYWAPFLSEAKRVLEDDGLIFAKLSDYVHNHKHQWLLVSFINAVEKVGGLMACDLIIKRDPCGGNLASGRWRNAHHVRNSHAWWIVVRKGRCEPKHKA